MTKRDLVEAAGYADKTIDFAIPQHFVDECQKLGIEATVLFCGWIYDEAAPHGRPLPMSELWVEAWQNHSIPPCDRI